MISEKDRSQLLRMAGNIAGNIFMIHPDWDSAVIACDAADIAFETMLQVDMLIEESKYESPS